MFHVLPLSLLVLAVFATSASAADFVVTRLDDPAPVACQRHDCSLREAVLAANARPGFDRILLAHGEHVLSRLPMPGQIGDGRGALRVRDGVEILGNSSRPPRIRWAGSSPAHQEPLFLVEADDLELHLEHLVLSHGRGPVGGCISGNSHSNKYVRLRSATVERCRSTYGGAIALSGSSVLDLDGVTLRLNHASSHGGALSLMSSALRTHKTVIHDNVADIGGGALYAWAALWESDRWVVWRELGGSIVRDNLAGNDGGAVLQGRVNLNILSDPQARPLRLTGNEAGARGGAIHVDDGLVADSGRLVLDHVHVEANLAAEGGGLYVQRGLLVADSWFNGNRALVGGGGAIHLAHSGLASDGRQVQRSGFNGNRAANGGAAVHNAGASVVILNSSFGAGNHALAGGADAVWSVGDATLIHVSAQSGPARPGTSRQTLRKAYHTAFPAAVMSLTNSLVVGQCQALHGGLFSNGGNQYGPQADLCPELPGLDQRQISDSVFGLGEAPYGGDFPVLGWSASQQPRPQRGFGSPAHCLDDDVRRLPRPGQACDSGAFEQQ